LSKQKQTHGRALSGALVLSLAAVSVLSGQNAPAPDNDLQVVAVRPNFYVISGAGSNIGVQIGNAGIVLADTGSADKADQVLEAIKRLTPGKVRYILNTGPDVDHVGGDEKLSKAGLTILSNSLGGLANFAQYPAPLADNSTNGGAASVMMPDNVLQRLIAANPKSSIADYTKSFTGSQYSMYLNGEGIQIIHQPAAHSDGDAFVFFRRNDVVMTGDIVDLTKFPVIDVGRGGSIQGEIAALNRLLDLVIPGFPLIWQEDRTAIVPGHGHVIDRADLLLYRDMVTIIRDVVQDMIGHGMTLQQIQKANPTQGYSRRYGADSGQWTTNMFVEAVYQSLVKAKKST
jgi:cyclase